MKYNKLEATFDSYLHLENHIASVTLFEDKNSFEMLDVPMRKHKSYYCQLVQRAVNGKSWKADLSHFSCETSAKILGLETFYGEEEGIQGWYDSGLYADENKAALQHFSVNPVNRNVVGVSVEALSGLSHDPDILIIVCKPYQAMRILQGYTYHYGYKKDFQMSGMCGVCFESTALPLNNHEFTISLLCSGTRFVCKWPEEMMMVSFPFDMSDKILDGIIQTAEHCEPNAYKDRIKHRLNRYRLPIKKSLNTNKAYFYKNKEKN